tara:strand:+ start:1227 stop:2507 length:1281 start_codon:yes stop_codon:yes gene_type:complete
MEDMNMEEVVLATLINYPDLLHKYSGAVSRESFLNHKNQCIFDAIEKRVVSNDCDLMTVHAALSEKNVIPDLLSGAELSEIATLTTTPTLIGSYVEELKKQTARVRLNKLHSNIGKMLVSGEAPDKIIQEVDSFSDNYYKDENHADTVDNVADKFLTQLNSKDTNERLYTGFKNVDAVLGGIEKSDLVIVAGVTSMGKTSFVLNAAQNMLKDKKSVGIFSLEMTSTQLVSRMCASESQVELQKIRYKDVNRIEMEKLTQAASIIKNSSLFIDSTSSSLSQVSAKITKWVKVNQVDIVVIDYLQLVRGFKGGSREQEVATVVRTLKNIAKQHNIAIIALSQLSRKVDAREGNKTPQLGDLRESGEIEQAADTVIFLYRPDYYDIEKCAEYVHETEVIIAKGRNSGTGKGSVMFIPKLTKFCDAITLS